MKYRFRILALLYLFVNGAWAFSFIGEDSTCKPFSKWILPTVLMYIGLTLIIGLLAGYEHERES